MKIIYVVGAGGCLGSVLVNYLSNNNSYFIYCFDRNVDKMLKFVHAKENIKICFLEDLFKNVVPLPDIIYQCAFSRNNNGAELIASINLTEKIFNFAAHNHVPKVVNISSQSVYGIHNKSLSKENDLLEPDNMYALAKYTTEKLSSHYLTNVTNIINIRLASLIGPMFPERFIYKLVQSAEEFSKINIIGGKQLFSVLDIRDAVIGLSLLLNENKNDYSLVYNLGPSICYNIIEIAKIIQTFFKIYCSRKILINIEDADININNCMDVTKFVNDFGWQIKYSLLDTIQEIYYNIKSQTI